MFFGEDEWWGMSRPVGRSVVCRLEGTVWRGCGLNGALDMQPVCPRVGGRMRTGEERIIRPL